MKISFALFCLAVGIAAANAADNTTMCHACLEDKFANCGMGDIENCTNPTTDSCFSAAGVYEFTNGTKGYFTGVSRGCVPCHNETEGCRHFKAWFDAQDKWSLVKCNMVCCKGDKCNNGTVDFPDLPTTMPKTDSSTVTMTPTTDHATRHFPMAMIFAIAAIVAALFFN